MRARIELKAFGNSSNQAIFMGIWLGKCQKTYMHGFCFAPESAFLCCKLGDIYPGISLE